MIGHDSSQFPRFNGGMCGLAGIISQEPFSEDDKLLLQKMLYRQKHRGPDATSITLFPRFGVGFLHRFIHRPDHQDLQPFISSSKSIFVWMNGEIFNHADLVTQYHLEPELSAKTDCEVAGPLYSVLGTDFLQKLNGDFALALYDRPAQKLILARDRLGAKPLHYRIEGRRLLFASEVKGLVGIESKNARIDLPQWLKLRNASWGFFPELDPATQWQGVRSIPPGAFLEFDLRDLRKPPRTEFYWTQNLAESPSTNLSVPSILEEQHSLFQDAFRRRWPTRVKSALSLSGGWDSGLIAAQAKADHRPLKCLTISTPSTQENGDLQRAKRTATELDISLQEVFFGQDADPALWRSALWSFESPLSSPEVYYKSRLPHLVAELQSDAKVLFSGTGSDEFNGGYTRRWLRRAGLENEKSTVKNLESSVQRILQKSLFVNGHLQQDGEKNLWTQVLKEPIVQTAAPVSTEDPLKTYFAANLQTLNFWNLALEDRLAMAAGIENRSPYLDPRLIDFALSIPARFRDQAWIGKAAVQSSLERLRGTPPPHEPKINFFGDSKGLPLAVDLMKQLIQPSGPLAQQAFEGADRIGLQKEVCLRLIRYQDETPHYRLISGLLGLFSLIVLEEMMNADTLVPFAFQTHIHWKSERDFETSN